MKVQKRFLKTSIYPKINPFFWELLSSSTEVGSWKPCLFHMILSLRSKLIGSRVDSVSKLNQSQSFSLYSLDSESLISLFLLLEEKAGKNRNNGPVITYHAWGKNSTQIIENEEATLGEIEQCDRHTNSTYCYNFLLMVPIPKETWLHFLQLSFVIIPVFS